MYTGLTAKLKVGTNEIGYISNWSVEQTRDTIEITELGVDTKKYEPSFISWTASAEGVADFTDNGQLALTNAFAKGEKVTAEFYLVYDKDNTAKLTYLTGSAIIDKLSVDISAEDKANISINLTGSGKLALIVPTQA